MPLRTFVVGWCAVAVAAVGGAAPAAAAPSPSPAAVTPTAVSDHPSATLGEMVRVKGSGWGEPGSGVVNVQVCGNGGVSRSVDCDLAGTASGAIRAGGTFFAAITMHRPPKPCPCVLRVTSSTTPYEVRIPIKIPGLPVAEISAVSPTNRALKVSGVSISEHHTVAAWFGAGPERTLQFTLANTGNVTLHDPAIDIAFGKGDDLDGFVTSPSIDRLAPGEKQVVHVPLPLAAGSFGTYRATVDADPIGGVTSKGKAETTTYPWGLFVVAIVLLQLLLLRGRNRLRRSTEARAAKEAAASGAAAKTDVGEGDDADAAPDGAEPRDLDESDPELEPSRS